MQPARRRPAAEAAGDPVPTALVLPSLDPTTLVELRSAAQMRQDEARAAGFEQGYEAGLQLAQSEVDDMVDHHRRARDRFLRAAYAIERALDQLVATDTIAIATVQHEVVELAVAIASELVGRELQATDDVVKESLERALALVPERGVPVARVHPDDAQMAREVLADDARWQGSIDIIGDTAVEPGGCVLEVGECRIDAQVGPAVERMRAALIG